MRAGRGAGGRAANAKKTKQLKELGQRTGTPPRGKKRRPNSPGDDDRPNSRESRASSPSADSRDIEVFARLTPTNQRRSPKNPFKAGNRLLRDEALTPSSADNSASSAERMRIWRSLFSFSEPELTDDISDEEDEEEVAMKLQRVRDSVRLLKVETKTLESRRERAFNDLGTHEHPKPGSEGCFLRFQRWTGILELRVRVQMKQILLQEQEQAYYKDVYEIVTSIKFEAFFALLIVLNAICIGWDTFYLPDDKRPFTLVLSEHLFTFLFLIEFTMRVMAHTSLWLCNWLNLFDSFLIWGPGVLLTWVLLPMGLPLHAAKSISALRILRLARLIKVIRIMKPFKELWMLVQGVMECSTLLIWAIVIGGMVHFSFAVAIMETVTKAEKFEDDEQVNYYFGSLVTSMFTLFQIMTADSWNVIVKPIVRKAPETMLIFGFFMGLAGIVLLNLMTAIVVRNANDAGERDVEALATAKNMENARLSAELLETFEDLDEDGSGALSQEEFNDCLDDYLFVRKMKMLDIDLEELPDFFDILDDGDGQVDQQEFISGMMKMQGRAQSSEMIKAYTLIKTQNANFSKLSDAFVLEAMDTYTRMEDDVDRLHSGMNDIMQLTAEVMQKLDQLGIRRILKSTIKDLPFVSEPEIEDLARADKRHAAAKRRGAKVNVEDDIEDQLPPQAKLENTVPASWIIREGRGHEAKNPGKYMLLRDPSLKDKIKNKSAQSRKVKKRESDSDKVVGVRQELGNKWRRMGVPLTEFSTLRTVASEPDGSLVQETRLVPLVNSMVDVLVAPVDTSPGDNVRQAWAVAPDEESPAAVSRSGETPVRQVSELALTPSSRQINEEPRKPLQHPHAVPAESQL